MILIIDDHPLILEGLSALLKSSGYDVIQARGGQQGIQLASDHKPQVVLCNFHMPDVDGLSVLHALKENPETISVPFIFVSSDGPESIRKRCTTYEADAVIHKGEAHEKIISAVEQCVRRRSHSAK